ncbi:carboxylic acid transport protein [Ophiocordyceps camponoti-floridani]|uniref:Carboxylic acid transport protein n=1 Tax=Ophiocordyceps camponoti-floridani TaxID=2030778 RepID=A0A8H4Q5D1_9HYPO|nr:carboxylic acid transport protein [Ophiocordyceps camponoti-floridani]
MADAFDFHALSVQTVKLASHYGRSKTDVTLAITLTLLLRSVGAAGFGLAGDRWGRKWPMVANMLVLGALQVATIYCDTYIQFLGVRSLFATGGLMSGILQQGYSLGYVLAAGANLGVGDGHGSWKTVFWIGAGFSITIGLLRALLPNPNPPKHQSQTATSFWRTTKRMLRKECKMCTYCILLMTWFNYYSHVSQDSYTTFMLTQKQLDNAAASRASIVMKAGACVGGCILGHVSQTLGRRRTIVMAALASGFMIPAWILPKGERALSATGFLMQFFVQGAWGVIPVHLNELSPDAFRATFPGVTYQIGNMLASPAAQMVNAVAERIFITVEGGHMVEAYGPVLGVSTAIVVIAIVITVAFGPERHGRSFGLETDDVREEADDESKRTVVVSEIQR